MKINRNCSVYGCKQNHVKVNNIGLKIKCAVDVIQGFGNAANKYHMNSTRHVNQTQITYSSTGKLSGAIFFIYQLEKWRVTNTKYVIKKLHFFFLIIHRNLMIVFSPVVL